LCGFKERLVTSAGKVLNPAACSEAGETLNPAACSEAGERLCPVDCSEAGEVAADAFVPNYDGKVLNTYSREKLIQILGTHGVTAKKTVKKATLVEDILNLRSKHDVIVVKGSDNMVEAHRWAKKAVKFAFDKVATEEFDVEAALWSEPRITMGTSFSGIGTPEWAVRYLSAAGRAMENGNPLAEFELRFVFDREAVCRNVLAKTVVGANTHIFRDILDRLNIKVLDKILNMEKTECDDKWSSLVHIMVGTALTDKGPCQSHSTSCAFPAVDVQVEGSPCVDWSTVGKGQGRQGPNAKALLAALLTVAATQPRCYIHENVPNFDVSIIKAVLEQVYDVVPIAVSPADAGHVECSRSRVYTVCIHKTKCKQVAPVDTMYLKLLEPLRGTVVNVEDAWRETEHGL
jgi:site-specific DNA-cytosine methylase